MDQSIAELLEALEFARSQDADTLHMNHMYGEWTEDSLGAMIDKAISAYRSEQDWERMMDNLREALS